MAGCVAPTCHRTLARKRKGNVVPARCVKPNPWNMFRIRVSGSYSLEEISSEYTKWKQGWAGDNPGLSRAQAKEKMNKDLCREIRETRARAARRKPVSDLDRTRARRRVVAKKNAIQSRRKEASLEKARKAKEARAREARAKAVSRENTSQSRKNTTVRAKVGGRSGTKRVPGQSQLTSPSVVKLLKQIRGNAAEVEVLRLHNYIGPGVSHAVIDAVLVALMHNSNCQALYIQNVNLVDYQIPKLLDVLKRGNIWCLNAGENDGVNPETWAKFVKELPNTNLTHAYVSEHYIPNDVKNAFRKAIRDNRKNHDRHASISNIRVIKQIKNMWWNPINSKALQKKLNKSN